MRRAKPRINEIRQYRQHGSKVRAETGQHVPRGGSSLGTHTTHTWTGLFLATQHTQGQAYSLTHTPPTHHKNSSILYLTSKFQLKLNNFVNSVFFCGRCSQILWAFQNIQTLRGGYLVKIGL